MSKTVRSLVVCIAVLQVFCAGAHAQAANGTWTQLISGGVWSDTNNWSGGAVADGSGSTADFSTLNLAAANIVHMDGPHTLTALTFADSTTPFFGWTLDNNGSTANILTLAGTTPSITVGTSSTATNSAEIAGSTAWSKAGTGTLTLSGSNSFSGDLTVSAGRLVVGHNKALGATSGSNSVTSGAALALGNGVSVTGETVTINGSGSGDFNGALTVAASTLGTWNGTVILGTANSRIGTGSGGTLTISGPIQGIGPMAVRCNDAAGTVIVSAPSGTNTYSSGTQIVQGTLKLGAENTLPTGTTLDVDSSNASVDSIFDLNGFNQTVAGLQRTGAGSGTGGSFVTNSGSAATLTINQSVNTNYSGTIAGSLALTKSGAGTLTLTGASSYTGATTISGGSLAIGTGGQLSTNSAIINNANLTANSTGSLIQGTHFSGAAITGTGSFTQLGTGTTTLNAANTFLGATLISAGKVVLGHTLALQNSAYDTTGSTGAIGLDVTGFPAPTLGGLKGGVDLATAITGYSAVTNLILNPKAGASNSCSGVIADGATGMTVTKTDAGTQGLSGTNTFTGRLTVEEGAISVATVNNSATDGVLGNSTSSVVLGSSSKSGTLRFTGATVSTTKKFTMATGGTGVFDTVSGQLTVNALIDGSGALSKTGAATLALAVANTFSGGATLGGSGVVAVTADSAGPAGAPTSGPLGKGTVNLAGAQIRAGTAGSRTIGNAITISADTTFATIGSEKSLTFTGPVTLSGGTRTLNVLIGSTVPTEKLTFSGAISDGGNALGIIKNGAGTLVLSGTNTYTGATAVNAGTLALASGGSLASTSIVVASGATLVITGRVDGTLSLGASQALSGNGTVLGSVNNDGVVSPGSSAGQLNINGSYAQTNGTLNIEIGGTNQVADYDLLSVSNTATLGGTLTVTLLNGYSPAANSQFVILQAASITNNFAVTNLPALTAGKGWSLQNSGGSLLLSVTGATASTGFDLYVQQITNAADRGYANDPDGDGYANLLEYVTGGNPTNSDQTARLTGVKTTNGVFALRFTRNTNSVDATLFVEGCYSATNDVTWIGIAMNSNGVWSGAATVTEDTATPANVTVQDTDAAATNRFLRLRVTRP